MALSALASGCSSQRSGGRRILHLALKTSPARLDPAVVVGSAEGELCAMLYQGLVRFSPRGEIVPDLARAWSITQKGSRYTFHLDTRMRFADGRPVRAADVRRSFYRVLSPETRSPRTWVLDRITGAGEFLAAQADTIAGIMTPDDSTVVLVLDEPFTPFLSMLAMPAAMITGEGSAGETGPAATVPIGSGRFWLAEWVHDDYLSLEPNLHHPGPPLGLDEVRVRTIPESFTRIAEFESGTLDILEVPLAELQHFRDEMGGSDQLVSRSELRVFYIGLNNTRPPFDDVRVRRALNMAVDVSKLIEVFYAGEAVRATGAIPPGLPGYESRSAYPYNVAQAKELLAEAGYPDGFEMEIWQRESPEGNRVVEAVQGYLAAAGVRVEIVRREWSAFAEAVSAGTVDAFFLDWSADYPDAENFLYPLFHSSNHGGGGNRAFFNSPEIDAMIESASRTPDATARAKLYAQTDQAIYEQAPWIYLYFPRSFHAISPRVHGYELPSTYLGADYTGVTLR